jgi:hypothetical protein
MYADEAEGVLNKSGVSEAMKLRVKNRTLDRIKALGSKTERYYWTLVVVTCMALIFGSLGLGMCTTYVPDAKTVPLSGGGTLDDVVEGSNSGKVATGMFLMVASFVIIAINMLFLQGMVIAHRIAINALQNETVWYKRGDEPYKKGEWVENSILYTQRCGTLLDQFNNTDDEMWLRVAVVIHKLSRTNSEEAATKAEREDASTEL